MQDMLSAFDKALADFSIIEQIDLPARAEKREPAPAAYLKGRVGQWLNAPPFARGLWTHQSEALRQFESGANVVISTGTASGKSLAFQAAALRLLEEDPNAAVLVFYPLKALVSDQLVSWRTALKRADYPIEAVARIDGDVLPDEREKIIESARIILATPDVTHAWLMSNLAKPQHKRFLGRLKLVVIDEAHVFDSVFGSNFAYLFRRIAVASRMADRSREPEPLRVIAASATIANPGDHLFALTGLQYVVVDESLDGSPQHARRVPHSREGWRGVVTCRKFAEDDAPRIGRRELYNLC
jgi:DEAD/DEAH box helicase domain-containing protein